MKKEIQIIKSGGMSIFRFGLSLSDLFTISNEFKLQTERPIND